jgi:hypothetical protein
MEPLLHVETETQRIHSLEIEVFAAYDTFDNVLGMIHWTNFLLSCLIDTIKTQQRHHLPEIWRCRESKGRGSVARSFCIHGSHDDAWERPNVWHRPSPPEARSAQHAYLEHSVLCV